MGHQTIPARLGGGSSGEAELRTPWPRPISRDTRIEVPGSHQPLPLPSVGRSVLRSTCRGRPPLPPTPLQGISTPSPGHRATPQPGSSRRPCCPRAQLEPSSAHPPTARGSLVPGAQPSRRPAASACGWGEHAGPRLPQEQGAAAREAFTPSTTLNLPRPEQLRLPRFPAPPQLRALSQSTLRPLGLPPCTAWPDRGVAVPWDRDPPDWLPARLAPFKPAGDYLRPTGPVEELGFGTGGSCSQLPGLVSASLWALVPRL